MNGGYLLPLQQFLTKINNMKTILITFLDKKELSRKIPSFVVIIKNIYSLTAICCNLTPVSIV